MGVPFQGKDIEVQEVEVITSHEPWNEYQLGDGKVLCTKSVLVDIYRAVEEKTPEGEPLYIIKSHNIIKIK